MILGAVGCDVDGHVGGVWWRWFGLLLGHRGSTGDSGSSDTSLVSAGVLAVCSVVLAVLAGQVGVVLNDEEVLGVAFLSGLREVERTGNDGPVVDEDNLVVGDGVAVVDEGGDALVEEEVEFAVVLGFLRFVEDDLAIDATFFRFEDGLGDRGRRERISLNPDAFS